MAKKKTENIKAAPVLRPQGSDQPTPTPTEQTGTRTYQIMDPWKDRDVVNLVDVRSVDGEITDVKVNGQAAGGGGVNYSMVNCINNSQTDFVIYLPCTPSEEPGIVYFCELYLDAGSDDDYKVLQGAVGSMGVVDLGDAQESLSVSGNITIDQQTGKRYNLLITGDGSITIS